LYDFLGVLYSITYVQALNKFTYTDGITISMENEDVLPFSIANVGEEYQKYGHFVSIDIVIYSDYKLEIIPLISFSGKSDIADAKYEEAHPNGSGSSDDDDDDFDFD